MKKQKKQKKPRKPRKPKDLLRARTFKCFIIIDAFACSSRDARKLAAWLTKAAEYLEAKEGEK